MPKQTDRKSTRIDRSTPQPLNAAQVAAERHLVDRARHGDLRAWEMVVRRHQESTFRLAVLMIADDDAATETARTAFVRAYRALPGLPLGIAFRPWLVGVVATTARAQRRELATMTDRHTRYVERAPTAHLPATPLPAGAEARALPRDLQEVVAATFDRLAWDERITIAARYLLGLPREEAATLLPIEPGEVDEYLRVAVERLRLRSEDTRLAAVPSDRLGPLAIAVVLGETPWTPDVAPSVTDRLVRDAIAYPEHFARNPVPDSVAWSPQPVAGTRQLAGPGTVKRTKGRITWVGRTVTGLAAAAVVGAGALVIVPGASDTLNVGGLTGSVTQPGMGVPAVDGGTSLPQGSPDDATSVAPIVDIEAIRARPAIPAGEVIGRRAGRIPVTIDAGTASDIATAGGLLLQQRTPGGGWSTVGSPSPTGATVVAVPIGRDHAFRVVPSDATTPAAAEEVRVRVVLRDSDSDRLVGTADGRLRQRDAIGGSVLSIEQGSTARTSFRGRGIALVGPVDPSSGTAFVAIDGQLFVTEDLAADERTPREVVLSEPLEPGRHTVVIGATEGSIELDAILILR